MRATVRQLFTEKPAAAESDRLREQLRRQSDAFPELACQSAVIANEHGILQYRQRNEQAIISWMVGLDSQR